MDFSLLVERKARSSNIVFRPKKMRNAEIPTFAAIFNYRHKVGTNELEEARFYGFSSADTTGASIADSGGL